MGYGHPRPTNDVAGRVIVVSGNVLAIALKERENFPLTVTCDQSGIHVGCTKLTREAWRLLKEIVDAQLAKDHVS